MPPKTKATITIKGDLAIITTQHGQTAVIPKEKLCDLAARYNLQYTNKNINCTTNKQKQYIEIE